MPDSPAFLLTDTNATDALPKQRRFLIWASLALIAYYWLGLSVKSLQLSLIAFDIAEKKHALLGLWIIWGWALWRYSQRLYELWSRIKDDVLADVNAEDIRTATRLAWRVAESRAISEEWATGGRKFQSITDIMLSTPGVVPGPGGHYVPNQLGGRTYPAIQASYNFVPAGGGLGATGNSFRWEWSKKRSIWHRVRAWIWALFRLPAVTEHFAPLVLALATAFAPIFDSHLATAPNSSTDMPCVSNVGAARCADVTSGVFAPSSVESLPVSAAASPLSCTTCRRPGQ